MDQVTPLRVERTDIDGLLRVQTKEIADDRGIVREFFRHSDWELHLPDSPLAGPWRQVNVTQSRHGALRGMHGEAMTKLVSVVAGEAFGAYVDTRRGSSSYGRVVTMALRPGLSVLVPPGVCNGFQSTSEEDSQYLYCFDAEWQPGMNGVAVSAFDPDLAIDWPLPVDPTDRALVSAKDASLPRLADLA